MMNITNAYLAGKTVCKTSPLYQYDYGQILKIVGIDLPEAYEVHFSNQPHGTATTQIGNADGVTIPDTYLTTGNPVYAWIYLHTGADDGETEYQITIPVIPRASISNAPPTPVQQDVITETIAALNTAVNEAEAAVGHYPKVEGGVWMVWDVTAGEYVSTGVQAQGPAGQDGDDGFSPTVTVTDITNGHRVTVTDVDGNHTFDVMDGEDGQNGAPGADGYSPTVTVTDITGGHTVTITDKDGEHSFNVMDGETPTVLVTDVQVNGVSVLDQGVANVPVASSSAPGVVRVNSSRGFEMDGDALTFKNASDAQLKAGTNQYRPITPSTQSAASFYGMAKAAGDSTQASSANPVGTYTDQAKTAIQSMIGAANENVKDQIDYAVRKTADLSSEGTADKYYDLNFAIGSTSLLSQQTKAGYTCAMIECHAGDIFTLTAAIYGSGGVVDDVVAWGFVQKTGPVYKLLDRGELGVSANNKVLVAPDDGYIVVNHYTSATYSLTASMLYKAVSDVQVNGTSVVTGGVANVPIATTASLGVVLAGDGLQMSSAQNGKIMLAPASSAQIKGGIKVNVTNDISKQHESTFYGLAKAAGDSTQSASSNAVGVYTESAKSAIIDMLNAPVSVSGSTPSITAMAGVRYICGEVSTLAVTVPASGCVDVVFESGSTPTVLTVTSAKTGVSAIKWANGWDGTCEANTTYEINILDGEYGVVGSWT